MGDMTREQRDYITKFAGYMKDIQNYNVSKVRARLRGEEATLPDLDKIKKDIEDYSSKFGVTAPTDDNLQLISVWLMTEINKVYSNRY